MYIKRYCIAFVFGLFTSNILVAQAIPISSEAGVYQFLDQMSLQYNFPWKDLVRPVNRSQITAALDSLFIKENLSLQQKKELTFYYDEFHEHQANSINIDKYYLGVHHKADNATIHFRPLLGGAITSNSKGNIIEQNIGINVWGSIQSKVDYLFSFQDITLNGAGVPFLNQDMSLKKYVNVGDASVANSKNYNELRVALTYRLKNGFISIGQDRFSWGYGQNAQIVQSQNTPAAPYLKLQYSPFKWLQFNYSHQWLQSNQLDSSATYSYNTTTYGGVHQSYYPKYYAQHSLTFIPKNGIELSIGESIVYTGALKPGYFIPVMYFKSYDNTSSNQNILAGDNGQFFAGYSIRRWIPNTQLYGQIFIDEIRVAKMFSNENRNQLGYQIGFKKARFLNNINLTIGAEYARIKPFVYNNINPVLQYTHHNTSLGDWMGNNADRLLLFVQYTPLPKWHNSISYQYIRKGGPGTVAQQYLANPQPNFLFDPLFTQSSFKWESRYQLMPQTHLQLIYYLANTKPAATNNSSTFSYFQLGFYMGMY